MLAQDLGRNRQHHQDQCDLMFFAPIRMHHPAIAAYDGIRCRCIETQLSGAFHETQDASSRF